MAEKIEFTNVVNFIINRKFPNYTSDSKQHYKDDKLLITKGLRIWKLEGDIYKECTLRETDYTVDAKLEPTELIIYDETDGSTYRALERVHYNTEFDCDRDLVEVEFVDNVENPEYRVHLLVNIRNGCYKATIVDTSNRAPLCGRILTFKLTLRKDCNF